MKITDWFLAEFGELPAKFARPLSTKSAGCSIEMKTTDFLGIMNSSLVRLLSVSIGLTAFAPAALSQTASDVARKAFPSVVMIVMEDANGQPNTIGSGFFVSEKVVASNFHVIEGSSRGFVKVIGDKTKHDIDGVVGLDELHDLVLLEIKDSSAPSLSLGESKILAIGEEIYAVGNPQGLEGTFSQGIISSIRQLEGGSLVQITAPISPGSSGGPVLNNKAEVVGVTVATYKGGQNLNFAIPSQYLKELLAKKGSPKPIQPLSKRTTQNSVLKDLGGKSTEGVVARRFEWPEVGRFKFSVANHLRQPIRSAKFLVVFYDDDKQPIDFEFVTLEQVIPAGLATWTGLTEVNYSTFAICATSDGFLRQKPKPGRAEIRVLGFTLVEE